MRSDRSMQAKSRTLRNGSTIRPFREHCPLTSAAKLAKRSSRESFLPLETSEARRRLPSKKQKCFDLRCLRLKDGGVPSVKIPLKETIEITVDLVLSGHCCGSCLNRLVECFGTTQNFKRRLEGFDLRVFPDSPLVFHGCRCCRRIRRRFPD